MKRVFILVLALVVLLPVTTKAYSFSEKSFKQALTDEKIDVDISSYKEDDKKADVYLFMGSGCTYCKKFLTFMANNVSSMGTYYNLHVYEVWGNADNKSLMDGVGYYLNNSGTGVPYIVIGDKVFKGYSSSKDEEMNNEIKNLYNSKDRYDVLKKMKSEKGIDKYIELANELKKNTVTTTYGDDKDNTKTTGEDVTKNEKTNTFITIIIASISTIIIILSNYLIAKKIIIPELKRKK